MVTFNDLKDLDPEKIKLLTSSSATRSYKTKMVTFNDLKELDPEKIKVILDKMAFEFLESLKKSVLFMSKRSILSNHPNHHTSLAFLRTAQKNFSEALFRRLFNNGYRRDIERVQIQEDVSAIWKLCYFLPADLFKGEITDKDAPIVKALAAQYLKYCTFTTFSYLSGYGIKFAQDIPKKELLVKLKSVINSYKKLNEDEVMAIDKIAEKISENMQGTPYWLDKALISGSIAAQLFEVVGARKSLMTSIPKDDLSKLLGNILISEATITELSQRYGNIFRNIRSPDKIEDGLKHITYEELDSLLTINTQAAGKDQSRAASSPFV
jgi:hypothetical protein